MTTNTYVASTDLRRWRLTTTAGAYRWTYHSVNDASISDQTFAEKFLLDLPRECQVYPKPKTFRQSAINGMEFFKQLQLDEGLWPCGYGGPVFLLAGLVFALYITESPIKDEWRIEIIRYIVKTMNTDGGWGLHVEDESNVFGTALYYLVLRILGMPADHAVATRARARLHALGGAIGGPQWAKIWLSCLNLYEWSGVNPVPPELWLLPDGMPFHPWRWWVQCRVVYLPTSYLWSNKCQMPLNPLLQELRKEIYIEEYSSIDFSRCCNHVAPTDRNRKLNPLLQFANSAISWASYFRPQWLHESADRTTLDLMRREDENTSYNCLAPVNKGFQMVAEHFAGDQKAVAQHAEKLPTYFWLDGNGLSVGGTNGVQLWDTAFTVVSVVEAGLGRLPEFRSTLEKALHFLDISQFRDNLADPYRQQRKGGWPFSTRDNGYIVSDCAAEGLRAVLLLQEECHFSPLISLSRLQDCVDTLLTMQNANGGYASYETSRSGTWLESLNPAETFDRIMVEYPYVECTAAVLTTLSLFSKHHPSYRKPEIDHTITRAIDFIKTLQRPDGSWYGSWAICFTYATFFALKALNTTGAIHTTSARVRKACTFLLSKQNPDGGWGEHHSSCTREEYIPHPQSQLTNTAWACLALMYARYPDSNAVERGLELIKSRQLATGEWKREAVEGVFNRTCMIGYPNYLFYFCIWALGMWDAYVAMLREGEECRV